VNDIVAAAVTKIDENAVYCTLPAYADAEAMLPVTEIGVRRGKRVADYVRVGQLVSCAVIRVEGAAVDVSLKQCREGESKEGLEKYHRDARVDLIVRSAQVPSLISDVIWPLQEEVDDVHAVFEETRIALEDGAPTRPEFPEALLAAIRNKMPPVTYTADRGIMLRFGIYHDGASRVQAALTALAAKEAVEVYVVAAPKYRVVARDRTPARAAARLAAACEGLTVPV